MVPRVCHFILWCQNILTAFQTFVSKRLSYSRMYPWLGLSGCGWTSFKLLFCLAWTGTFSSGFPHFVWVSLALPYVVCQKLTRNSIWEQKGWTKFCLNICIKCVCIYFHWPCKLSYYKTNFFKVAYFIPIIILTHGFLKKFLFKQKMISHFKLYISEWYYSYVIRNIKACI